MMRKLGPDELYRRCDVDQFAFATTEDIPVLGGTIGQEKALRSLDFGLGVTSRGFNIFALGEPGTGKTATVKALLSDKAAKEKVPPDWCYVYNFKNPDAATAISMEPGQGKVFQKEMEDFLKALKIDIPKAFESKEYEKQRSRIVEEFQQKQNELFSKLDEEAHQKGFTVRRGMTGVLLLPLKEDGEALTPEEFGKLDENKK